MRSTILFRKIVMRAMAMAWIAWSAAAGPAGPTEPERPDAQGNHLSVPGQVIWYLPHRVADFFDIFRLRLRLGPGLSAHARVTDYSAFFAGTHDTVYLGLPGSRCRHRFGWPAGRESLTGIALAGVDATDRTPHGPRYRHTEVAAGAHILVAGLEAGLDPEAIKNFLLGWVAPVRIRAAALDRRHTAPDATGAVAMGEGFGPFRVADRPEQFASWADRLDYLHANVQTRFSEPLRAADTYFAACPESAVEPPQTRVRMKLFSEVMHKRSIKLDLTPHLDVDMQFPNLERRLRLFIETSSDTDLPERPLSEREDSKVHIGARKWFDALPLSADAGIRARHRPEAFARLSWYGQYAARGLYIHPRQTLFLNTREGAGALSSLGLSRWLGGSHPAVWFSGTSVKWATEVRHYAWSHEQSLARVTTLIEEHRRGRPIGWADMAHATGLRYVVFGEDDLVLTHRVQTTLRRPLFKDWFFGELSTGVEWERENDFGPAFFVHAGLDLLFWSRPRD